MAESVTSTAYGTVFITALEQCLPEQQRIIDDATAYQMLPLYAKLMVKPCNFRPLWQAFFNLLEKTSPGVYTGLVCRKRYIGDKVTETLNAGIDSLVILGAGLDTLAYRIPQLSSAHVYEVDLPENINYKRKKLEALFGTVPAHVSLVPVDFEAQRLESALKQAGYSFDQRTFFVWEGVTQYLTEVAVRDTFAFLAKAKSGSHLAFTYVMKDFIDGQNMYESAALYQRFRVKSQVWQFGIHPHDVARFIGEYGWKELEQVGADECSERYLKPIGRTGLIAAIERVVYAEKLSG
jgi:methyltransferase (TIGR00027 family)